MGGKKALRALLYKLFPKDYGRYIEVFGGGGWVLFGKLPEKKVLEVYNDFNGNLTNLFSCVKSRTMAFLKELGFLPLNSRHEFGVLRRYFEKDGRQEVGNAALTYEKTIKLTDDDGKTCNVINYRHYNKKRKREPLGGVPDGETETGNNP